MKRNQFQFHKGTIKTCATGRDGRSARPFQFHKGTIKTACYYEHHARHCHFNSIKVQLKRNEVDHLDIRPQFQFHKGTIKTLSALYKSFISFLISIP